MVDKIGTAAQAANLYATAQKATQGPGLDAPDVSFGDLMKTGLQNTINTVKESEKVSAAAVAGKASVNDVVQAVTAAELAMKQVMAIRDRAIAAYQEIQRMPI